MFRECPSLMLKKVDWQTRWLKDRQRVQQTGHWDWRDWQVYLHSEDKGVAKPIPMSKVKETSKLASIVPTLTQPKSKNCALLILSCRETTPPSPALFLPPHQCPALTQPAVSSIIKSLCRPGFPPLDSQAACSFLGHVNWSFWAQLHRWYLFHMWHWPLRAHGVVWVIILNEALCSLSSWVFSFSLTGCDICIFLFILYLFLL